MKALNSYFCRIVSYERRRRTALCYSVVLQVYVTASNLTHHVTPDTCFLKDVYTRFTGRKCAIVLLAILILVEGYDRREFILRHLSFVAYFKTRHKNLLLC